MRSLREKGREFQLDFPIAKILQNMKSKSQDTVKVLNPHHIYLNVNILLTSNHRICTEKKTAGWLDKRGWRKFTNSFRHYSPLRPDDGSLHFDSVECTQPWSAIDRHYLLDDLNEIPRNEVSECL